MSDFGDNCNIIDDILTSSENNCNYIDLENCTDSLSESYNNHQYCALHLNIHSLPAKFDDLKHLIATLNSCKVTLHFILLCETFLTDNIKDMYNIAGYDMICANRKKGQRGGIAIYVLKEFSHITRDDISVNINQEFESLFIEVSNKGQKMLVGEIYRVPNTSEKKSIEMFDVIANNVKSFKGNVIIGTDQNFDLLKYNDNNNIRLLLNTLIESGLLPTITKPTRVTHSSATAIDNIYIKGQLCYSFCSNVIETDISDHYPVIAFIGKPDGKTNKGLPQTIKYRYLTTDTYVKINQCLNSIDWSVLHSGSVNDSYSHFSKTLTDIVNEAAPLKTKQVSFKHLNREPWMTKGLLISIKRKAKLFNKCKGTSKDGPAYNAYINYNKLLNKVKRKAKSLYLHKLLQDNMKNIKKTWQILNSLLGKVNDKTSVSLLKINNKQIADPKEITEEFAKYFTNVGRTQSSKIPSTNKRSQEYMDQHYLNNSAFFIPTDFVEVCEIINNMKSSNTKGYDEISSVMLKNIMENIAFPISILINRSLLEGQFPDDLKIAKVVPLYKAKSKDDVSNYRPISVLSCISKIYEKVIHKRLLGHLQANNLLSPFQFGFRPKHSTCHAVTKLTEDILLSFENREITLAVFCDLSKAFDTLDHSIILNKLYRYGVRGSILNLFESYLNKRCMYVTNGTNKSEIHEILAFGVPQGSVLGPLLFNIYVNDLGSSLNHSSHILYADDTTLYITGKNINDLFLKMNIELDNLSAWFKANKLALNINKTNYIVFSPNNINTVDMTLTIDSIQLQRVDSTKFLGIYMDSRMTWEHHINYVGNKMSSGLYILNSLKHTLPSYNLSMIYFSLIHCRLTYGCLLWGNSYKKYMNKINTAQNKAMRAVCKVNYNTSASPLFKAKKIMKVNDIYNHQVCQYMYKMNNNILPAPLLNVYNKRSDIHHHLTRHCQDFSIPNYKHNIVIRSFIVNGPKQWFNLSEDLKKGSLKHFCKELKMKFVKSY